MIKVGNYLYGFSIFLLFGGIYLFPEKTKLITISACIIIMTCYIFNRYCKIININEALIWGLFLLLGSIMSICSGVGLSTALEFSITILVGQLLGAVYMDEKKRAIIIKAIIIVTVIVLIGCIMQLIAPSILASITRKTLGNVKYMYFSDFISYGALVGFSYQTGVTGYYLAILDGLLLCFLLGKRNKSKIYISIILILYMGTYILILLTGKRSQLLAVMILSVLLVALHNKKHFFKILSVMIFLLIGAYVLLNFTSAGQTIIKRSTGANPTSSRNLIYNILLENFAKSPIFGNGFGYTLNTVHNFTNGHNIYLQVLSENGITGLILFIWLLLLYGKQAFKIAKYYIGTNSDSCVAPFVIYIQGLFVLNGLTGNPLYDVFPIILFIMSSGMAESMLLDTKIRCDGGLAWMNNY